MTVAVVGPCTDLLLALVTVGVSSGLLGSMVVLFIVNCVPHVRDGSELCKQLEIASRVGVAHQAKLSSIQVESASIWRWSNNFCRSHNHRSNWTQSRYKPDSLLRLPASVSKGSAHDGLPIQVQVALGSAYLRFLAAISLSAPCSTIAMFYHGALDFL